MRTLWSQRKRYPSQQVTGGLTGILAGVFGIATPGNQLSSEVSQPRGLYHFHEGDLFTPGTGNWAMDPSHQTPLFTQWGRAFLSGINVFCPVQPPQVYSHIAIPVAGIGGLVAGQIVSQPLLIPESES